jgi:hypothetical protein
MQLLMLKIDMTAFGSYGTSILAHLHPALRNPNRVTYYMKYFSELNIILGLKLPLSSNDVPKLERLNPFLRVNVLTYENADDDFIPLYVSPHRDRQTTVNLLLIAHRDKRHYVLINSVSRLVCGRSAHKTRTYVCEYYLHPCSTEDVYNQHLLHCSMHMPQRVTYPEPDSKLKWNSPMRTEPVPFVIFCDFESFLTPEKNGQTKNAVDTHVPSGFCAITQGRISHYRPGRP